MYTTALDVVSAVFVLSGLFAALIVWLDLRHHPQAMQIMNSVWVLTALWGGFLALWVYYRIGRPRPGAQGSLNTMLQKHAAGMPGLSPGRLRVRTIRRGLLPFPGCRCGILGMGCTV